MNAHRKWLSDPESLTARTLQGRAQVAQSGRTVNQTPIAREAKMDALERIKQQVTDNPVMLYMKGSPDFPQCGFSARTVGALKSCGVPFGYINIYEDEEVYRALPKFANWPTFPQLYVKGELIGGCDITLDLFQSGELQKMLEEASSQSQTN
jgi:monothiol glutaredoxin